MFLSVTEAVEKLLDYGILASSKYCPLCSSNMDLKVYSERSQRIVYRCINTSCRHKKYLTKSKLAINDMIYLYYNIFNELSYKQVRRYSRVPDSTILRAKKALREAYSIYSARFLIVLGGPGFQVECDETVLSRRGIIVSPTSTSDLIRDTVWILGAIDNTNSKNFILKRIPNRTTRSLTETLEGKINVLSRFLTDGYPSYSGVAENLGLVHHVVNHSEGFMSEDGIHTNNIEGFWSHLKAKMRSQHGVQRDNIDEWIDEYSFYRRFIQNSSDSEIDNIFIEILTIIMNKD